MSEHDESGEPAERAVRGAALERVGAVAPAEPPGEGYPSLRRNRTFVRFLVGRLVTNAGDSLYAVATLWLVFQLTGSTVFTGVAEALLLLPWLLQAAAGPVVDRFPIKRLLVGTQFAQGVTILALPLAAHTGHLSVGLVLVTIPVLALLTLVLGPAQAALVPRIVADDQLSTGNSLLATVTLGLDMLFEAAGGVLIALFGAMALFVADSLTFVVAGVLFAGMAIPPADGGAGAERGESAGVATNGDSARTGAPGETAPSRYLADLREGVAVLRGTVFVDMLLASAVVNFAVGATLAVLPAFGAHRGGPAMYGLLLGALGVGRVVGSVAASSLTDLPYGRLRAVAALCSAVLWAGSVYAPSRALALSLFALAWVPPGVNGVLVTTLTQRAFPGHLLGRVSATKGTLSAATLPVGSLVGGVVGWVVGPTTTVGLSALGFGFAGVYFIVKPSLWTLPATSAAGPADFGVEVPGER